MKKLLFIVLFLSIILNVKARQFSGEISTINDVDTIVVGDINNDRIIDTAFVMKSR